MVRSARSLDTLLSQLNHIAPARSTTSDGGIGDAAHRARVSDHNPDVHGVYHARDFTNDPSHGLSGTVLTSALVASRDPRIKYLIWNGRILSGTGQDHTAWVWRRYLGLNRHTKHVHLSVKSGPLGDDPHPWALPGIAPRSPNDPTTWTVLHLGDTGPSVRTLQTMLRDRHNSKVLTHDRPGVFGRYTEAAVKAVQRRFGITATGQVGPQTWPVIVSPR